MFSVIISEKGGAERRESFDRTEINVGRVQGNDLMLPKGNVSKRHARLLYRDGRFIVTDLKSTNGTYVNGRKIAQATIVREGDKIYIGDFVLRIEASSAAGAVSPTGGPPGPIEESSQGDLAPSSPPLAAGANTSAQIPVAAFVGGDPTRAQAYPPMAYEPTPARIPLPYEPGAQPKPGAGPMAPANTGSGPPPTGDTPSSQPSSSSAERGLRAPAPRIEPKTGDPNQVISHFPLEHDPDDSAMLYPVPGPPRVPSPGRPQPAKFGTSPSPRPGPGATPVSPGGPGFAGASGPSGQPIERGTSPSVSAAGAAGAGSGLIAAATTAASAVPAPALATGRLAIPPTRLDPPEPLELSRIAAHRAAIVTLLDRVSEATDLRPLENGEAADEAMTARVERSINDRLAALREQGDIRPEVDTDAVIVEARRELLEYGPLTALLNDDDVSEIHVVRHDYVLAIQGRRQVPSDIGFSNERSLGLVIRRLCITAGRPLAEGEVFVERRLPRGTRMLAVIPTAPDQGHMVVIRKPQRADVTLEDLVRSGTISRAMAGLLAQCVEARANILVTGAVDAGASLLLGALCAAGSTTDRVIVLEADDELIFTPPHTVAILLGDTPEQGARAVRAAALARPDRLVVGALSGRIAAGVVDAMSDGVDGVLAAARAPTLRQATARLAADIAATKAGLSPEIAREWIASTFHLAIEIARLRDGRLRVLRLAELSVDGSRIQTRDIFTFAVERTAAGGAVEGSFHPTGIVPAIVEDLAARGVSIDPSIFKRHAGNRPG
jgi:pilus assembly protein CpaF